MIEGKITIDPDLDFIKKIKSGGGDHLKKCYQCATCSVSCSLSSDMNPFPRKEIVYASWGLKDKLMADPNIWHCYNCGDCSQRCPRGVRPGDVLNAIRKEAICHYSKPSIFNTLIGDPKYIPLLLLFPAIVIIVIGLITGMLNFTPSKEDIVFANFFPIPLIELIFIPLSLFSALVFFVGLKRFATDMRGQFFEQQGTKLSNKIDWIAWLKTTVSIFPSIVKHENFADCSNSKNRKLSHMMVSFSFVTLAGVAGAFVFALYVLKSHGPYSQLNPIKIIANLSGFVLILGSLMLMKNRIYDPETKSSYFDWYLLGLVFLLGVTGMLTQFTRLMGVPFAAYTLYFIHLIVAFNLIAFLPYTKMAHFVYRVFAISFDEYMRKQG